MHEEVGFMSKLAGRMLLQWADGDMSAACLADLMRSEEQDMQLIRDDAQFANEVCEGMHAFWWRTFQRVASESLFRPGGRSWWPHGAFLLWLEVCALDKNVAIVRMLKDGALTTRIL